MKYIAILGFGVEGKDAAQYFLSRGAEITVFDKKEKNEIDTSGFDEIKWKLGGNYLSDGLEGFDLIVRSPGVRPDLAQIIEAVDKGSKLTSTTKIFFDDCIKPIIAVTGTKGKGTTSSLIAEGLKACGKKVILLGNIGEPMLESLDQANKSDYVVLELSSFQTMDLTKSPHIAVVTNITSDHMDWHKNQDEYEKAKEQLWKNQVLADFLVLNWNDATSKKLSTVSNGVVVWYSSFYTPEAYVYTKGNEIWSKGLYIGNASELKIPGKHNLENALAAIAVARLAKADIEKAWKGIISFEGLEHRLEKVAEIEGVLWVNDSFATNPEPTLAAIASFEQPKVMILGGSSKGASFDAMAQKIVESNVRGVVLIVDEAENIKRALVKAGYKQSLLHGNKRKMVSGKSKSEPIFTNMEDIVHAAHELAQPGDVVLLSPACASFGLFKNYKDRGKQFKEAVIQMLKS